MSKVGVFCTTFLVIGWFGIIQADGGGAHLVLRPSEGPARGEGEG